MKCRLLEYNHEFSFSLKMYVSGSCSPQHHCTNLGTPSLSGKRTWHRLATLESDKENKSRWSSWERGKNAGEGGQINRDFCLCPLMLSTNLQLILNSQWRKPKAPACPSSVVFFTNISLLLPNGSSSQMKIKFCVIRGRRGASSAVSSTHLPYLPGNDFQLWVASAAVYKQSCGWVFARQTEWELDFGHL